MHNKMKLHFDPNQQFQIDAINSIVGVFEGQSLSHGDFSFTIDNKQIISPIGGVGNQLTITDEQILKNVQNIQKKNLLPVSTELDGLNFSVEMETGTGKTYVYLRTIYELNKIYGFKKFLVINIDSFAKDENIINRPNDKLTGKKPVEFIQATKPIVIVDEPQNMETELRKKAIENLNPLCTLRYSATHINCYNMVYSLDPVKAYDLGLVKQIEVDSIVTENEK